VNVRGFAAVAKLCLSADAYHQVRDRLDLAVCDLGQTQLKNITEPIRVCSLRVGVPAQAKPAIGAKSDAPRKSSARALADRGIPASGD
jgi:adenylate cyclase